FPPPRTPSIMAHNLPRARTSFIGRVVERDEILGLLAKSGVVTIVGAGGVGKTRLAIEVAFDAMDRYDDGVCLVDLAAVSDPALVVAAVARVFGVREVAGRSLMDVVVEALQSTQTLLVMDNC